MSKPTTILIGLAVILAICTYALWPASDTPDSEIPLTLFCAAGLQKPVNEIVKNYESETGRKVNVIYNGSGALLSQIQIAEGDLYLPANDAYVQEATQKNLIAESIPTAFLTAVIVTQKDNTSIQNVQDLTKPGIRLSFADKSAAIGKYTRNVLAKNNLLSAIEKNITVTKPTVNNIVEDVSLGTVDATIAWDAVAHAYPNTKTIPTPIFSPRQASITILKKSPNPTAALHFARYLTATEKGIATFKKNGFQTPEKTDQWANSPEILIFSGSMLRPAIEQTLADFQKRENCKIITVYEGCGTLISQMKAGANPAFYYSCDTTFLDQVQDRFEQGTILTSNQIIIIVPKGNPKNITNLSDLTKPNLKIGIAHPTKSALGALTQTMLKNQNLLTPLNQSGNLTILASKGDELVTQMQANALDAALIYNSNALSSEDITNNCTIIHLNLPEANATQPFASAKNTNHPNLLKRLEKNLQTQQQKQSFQTHGFTLKP